jgi:hypothetical protein
MSCILTRMICSATYVLYTREHKQYACVRHSRGQSKPVDKVDDQCMEEVVGTARNRLAHCSQSRRSVTHNEKSDSGSYKRMESATEIKMSAAMRKQRRGKNIECCEHKAQHCSAQQIHSPTILD